MKLPHELYGLSEESASKVLKHIATSYVEGLHAHETISNFIGNKNEKLFCAFYVGYIVGLHTQFLVPDTATILGVAIRTKNEELINKIAKDIASDFNAPVRDIEEGLVELIESNGKQPESDNIWHHVVYGIFRGVDHQATFKQRIENVLYFLGTIHDKTVEEITILLRRRKAEICEDRLKDAI